jgi:hypothetical protein
MERCEYPTECTAGVYVRNARDDPGSEIRSITGNHNLLKIVTQQFK